LTVAALSAGAVQQTVMTADILSDFLACTPGFAFIADRDGTLRQRSEALAARFGHRLGGDATLTSLASADDQAIVAAFLSELAQSEAPVTCTIRVPEADGAETFVRCSARRSLLPGSSIHGQLELVPATDAFAARVEHALFRILIETLDITLWAAEHTGKIVFSDGKALATAGLAPGQLVGLNIFEIYPPELMVPVKAALAGTASTFESEVHGVHWKTWTLPLKNDAGEIDHCVGLALDVTSAVQTKRDLERQLGTIRNQQRAIHEMAAPVLRVWDDVLTVPLIGTMDAERTNEIAERLLAEANRSNTRFVILDLTGVETLDTLIANHVLRLIASLRLLGVDAKISGISPHVAHTMVGLGIDLRSVQTYRSLREALRDCMLTLMRPTQSVGV
jgi:rsbT co-antagonist protein RsbR